MERSFFRGVNGQASIEFILLIILMLLYIQTLILPEIDIGRGAARGVIGLGEARFAAEKIVNAVNYVGSSSGEAKETISVFVPKGAELRCDSEGITVFEYQVNVQKENNGTICGKIKDSAGNLVCTTATAGTDGKCYTKCTVKINFMSGITVNTYNNNICPISGSISGLMYDIPVQKEAGKITVG
ncbi:MAG: hypothetical protein V1676_01590 [Candidatus Diapherotrites archaeon]